MIGHHPFFTLIEGGELWTPDPAGTGSVLAAGDTIVAVGEVDRRVIEATGLGCHVIDAGGAIVCPGFIDPHQHIIGGAGEEGFGTRTPEVTVEELVRSGVTTVVGLLGTDTITRHLTSLIAKARQLEAAGLSAWMYTGGFPVPPPTLTGSITADLVIVDKVIGVGEIAIADERAAEPTVQELARLVSEALVGGRIAGKAGVTHFHTGPSDRRLSILHRLLDEFDIPPRYVYATHITRGKELMDDAIALGNRGAWVDIDTVDDNLGDWLPYYFEQGGRRDRLTVSSDAHTADGAVEKLRSNITSCVRDGGLPMDAVLSLVTRNPATALGLARKGRVAEGMDADLLVLERQTFEIQHVVARGRRIVESGAYSPAMQHGEMHS